MIKRIKTLSTLFLILASTLGVSAQYKMGNWAYTSATPIVLNANNIAVPVNYNDQNIITIKGMYNATPDAYVAIFSLSQEAEDESTTNNMINSKIEAVRTGLKAIDPALDLHVDIISFVPVYDQVLEKKVFSKNTLTETPIGFELKKNIIIEYKRSEQLNDIFSLCTSNGIYDYIRSDVVVKDMGAVKARLRDKADSMVYDQMERYAKLRDIDLKDYKRTLAEGYTVVYPGEKYSNYTAFSCTSYFTKKFNLNNDAKKKITKHYLPIIDKEFDFVIKPFIAEPTIQVMYQINLVLIKKPAEQPKPAPPVTSPEKKVFLITPQGQIREINLN